MIHQQGAHLPAVAHLFNHDARDGTPIPVSGSILQKIALLLDASKLSIALIDDHVHQRVAHLLRRHLAQVLPLAPPLVRPEFDLLGIDRTIERIEVKGLNVRRVDANVLAPIVKHAFPITEGSDLRYFAWHSNLDLITRFDYFALKTAGRFSTYAAKPSFASSLWNRICWFSRSTASADSIGISHPVCTARLIRPTALAALFGGQNCLAYSIMFSMNPSRS